MIQDYQAGGYVTDFGSAKTVRGHDRFESITRRLAARNVQVTQRGGVSVLSLAESDSHATLLENGKPVARWSLEDPYIARHIEALLGE